jgi:hypothetical protein
VGRPEPELTPQLRLVALQLLTQQLPEQLVVAVPRPLAIQRDDQQVDRSSDASTATEPVVRRLQVVDQEPLPPEGHRC